MPRVMFITNMPVPYRERLHQGVAQYFEDDYLVVYLQQREFDRSWNVNSSGYSSKVLNSKRIKIKNREVYYSFLDLMSLMSSFKPDVVINCGFSPTNVLAYIYSKCIGSKHIIFTDGWLGSERLNFVQKIIRKLIYSKTDAVITPSLMGEKLAYHYGGSDLHVFRSCLFVDNQSYNVRPLNEKDIDFLFVGRLIPSKNPDVVISIAERLSLLIRKPLHVAFVGDGPLLDKLKSTDVTSSLRVSVVGFMELDYLRDYYSRSKFLLFPVEYEAWGIVVNEAMASGVPVITTPGTAVSFELVQDNENGLIYDDVDELLSRLYRLMMNAEWYQKMSKKCIQDIKKYNEKEASEGIVSAVDMVSA